MTRLHLMIVISNTAETFIFEVIFLSDIQLRFPYIQPNRARVSIKKSCSMTELRQDPTTKQWVIIATERAKRPHDL